MSKDLKKIRFAGAAQGFNWLPYSLRTSKAFSNGTESVSSTCGSAQLIKLRLLCMRGQLTLRSLMNGQELAAAAQYGATRLVIVMDNQEYGTIRTHQERRYPERISGTQLKNPEFALMAQAFGGFHIKVESDSDVPAAIDAALKAIDRSGAAA